MKRIFSFLLAVSIMITTVICAVIPVSAADISEGSISKICKLREQTGIDIKITDVRNNLSSVAAEFNHDELEEILEMVNDYYNDTFAEESHYESSMNSLSKDDVSLIYETIMNPSSGSNLPIGLIAIVAVGVVVFAAIIFIIIAVVKKQGFQQQNTVNRQNGQNYDSRNYNNESQSDDESHDEYFESKPVSRSSSGHKTVVIQDED